MLANLSLIVALAASAITVGQKPKSITLKGEDGGKVDGTPWDSDSIKDKVYVLFYVDPDEKGEIDESVRMCAAELGRRGGTLRRT